VGLTRAEQSKAQYLYAHDYKHGVVPQQYLPDSVTAKSTRRPYYRPTEREQRYQERMAQLEELLERARRQGLNNWKLKN
jgi:putative ATPase